MKNDTSTNIIDLDVILNTTTENKVEEVVEFAEVEATVDIDEVLTEWCYKLPKGYPTVVDGKFVDADEVKLLNELLVQRGLNTLTEPEQGINPETQAAHRNPTKVREAVLQSQLSSNPTDVKEAFVCLFVDALLENPNFSEDYLVCLDLNTTSKIKNQKLKSIKSTLANVTTTYGKNYGIAGYEKMSQFVIECLVDKQERKSDVIILNNGLSTASAILSYFGNKIKAGMVRRDSFFENIRKQAVKLIDQQYNIKNYYPDNWCPGDIYFKLNAKADKAVQAENINLGKDSLNSYFYGSNNPKGSIIAVSLKMQKAQAGKGTTFLKNVVINDVSLADKLGKDEGAKEVIKFRELNRQLEKYYFNDTWKKDSKAREKAESAVRRMVKMLKIVGIPIKASEKDKLKSYMLKNKNTIQTFVKKQSTKLNKSINSVTSFQQAYTRFVKGLRSMNIQKVEGNSADFLKKIEFYNKQANKGKLNQSALQGILSQKAATYDLASTLIEKWTEETKKISPAFAQHLSKVKNPFVAITMFAIAQHGLNPDFYKAIGTNKGTPGSVSEFPSNSTVDETKSIEQLKVVDSPGQAGFYIEYNLTINNHTYRTTLTFRFSKDQIRVEVEELAEVK